MAKAGRNDPCPCGSGKKYKHCCWQQDREAELAPAIAQRVAIQAQAADLAAQRAEELATWQEAQALDKASNAVVDLVHAGRLEEAEQGARELLVRYPEMPDGNDRLGMVHEARGQFREAANCYRLVIGFAKADPEAYDPEFVEVFEARIAQLDAQAAAAEEAAKAVDPTG